MHHAGGGGWTRTRATESSCSDGQLRLRVASREHRASDKVSRDGASREKDCVHTRARELAGGAADRPRAADAR